MIGKLRLSLAASVGCLVLGCALAQAEMTVEDATGTMVEVEDVSRVVSVGGSLTEIIYALDAQDHLAAVDTTSLYPPQAQEFPNVGYVRALSAEGVLSLSPTLILAEEDAGPDGAIEQIRAAGVPMVVVPDDPSVKGMIAKISLVAALLGREARGQELTTRLQGEADALALRVDQVQDRPRVLFLLHVGSGSTLGGGAGTSADGIIRLAGGENALAAMDGFKPVSIEAAVASEPDVILLTTRTVEMLGGMEAVHDLAQISLTKAGQDGNVVAMDGLLLLGFGPRTVDAASKLHDLLYPGGS